MNLATVGITCNDRIFRTETQSKYLLMTYIKLVFFTLGVLEAVILILQGLQDYKVLKCEHFIGRPII